MDRFRRWLFRGLHEDMVDLHDMVSYKINILKRQGEQMAIDLSKLQAVDTQLAGEVQTLVTTIQAEAVTLQAAIDALAGAAPGDQAAVDAVVGDLTTVANNLTAATASVQALPTTPTPPAA